MSIGEALVLAHLGSTAVLLAVLGLVVLVQKVQELARRRPRAAHRRSIATSTAVTARALVDLRNAGEVDLSGGSRTLRPSS